MTEKSHMNVVVENSKNFPPMDFYNFVKMYIYLDGYGKEHEMYDSSEYHNWYHKHVIDNYQFNTRVFILRDPEAIRIFENIINDDDFFKHVIYFLDEFKPLKDFISKNFPELIYKQSPACEEISPSHAEVFTKNIIIPEKYNTISEYDIKSRRDLLDFFMDNPIKINVHVGYSIARLGDHLVFKFY